MDYVQPYQRQANMNRQQKSLPNSSHTKNIIEITIFP